jgi:hypothetical protein
VIHPEPRVCRESGRSGMPIRGVWRWPVRWGPVTGRRPGANNGPRWKGSRCGCGCRGCDRGPVSAYGLWGMLRGARRRGTGIRGTLPGVCRKRALNQAAGKCFNPIPLRPWRHLRQVLLQNAIQSADVAGLYLFSLVAEIWRVGPLVSGEQLLPYLVPPFEFAAGRFLLQFPFQSAVFLR